MTMKWIMALMPWAFIGWMLWDNRDVLWPKYEDLPDPQECIEEQRKRYDEMTEWYKQFGRINEGDKHDH